MAGSHSVRKLEKHWNRGMGRGGTCPTNKQGSVSGYNRLSLVHDQLWFCKPTHDFVTVLPNPKVL